MLDSSLATRARSHYRGQQRYALAGVAAARKAARGGSVLEVAKAVAGYQMLAAKVGSETVAREVGVSPVTPPLMYAGTTQLGYPITEPLTTILDRATKATEDEIQALTNQMLASLDLFVMSEVIAAGADAASVEVAAANARYVRVLVPPSCDRCTILAGRVYRSAEAFPRHPRCDCQHWPVGSEDEARAAGLILDPEEAFEKGQVGGYRTMPDGSQRFVPSLSKADAQAIRDGADMAKVVNAKRGGGTRPAGMTNAISAKLFGRTVKATTDGTTVRAAWRKAHPNLPVRLRPESIYEHAKDRDDAIRLLKLYGYIT